ncbi:MAG: hypothetical protein K0S28_841 [Paucimonas sp.]|jgi:hypothetical protein|nr:hypothetical protein [Paucimonas sp.]
MLRPSSLVVTLLICLPLPAFAVFKCEAGGKTIYSDTPCAGGKMTQLNNLSAPTAADAADARMVAERQRREAKEIDARRRKQEAQDEKDRERIAKAAAKKREQCAKLALKGKWAAEDAAKATGPKGEKLKVRAQRSAETYAAECKNL